MTPKGAGIGNKISEGRGKTGQKNRFKRKEKRYSQNQSSSNSQEHDNKECLILEASEKRSLGLTSKRLSDLLENHSQWDGGERRQISKAEGMCGHLSSDYRLPVRDVCQCKEGRRYNNRHRE